jgi:hypothetical protein
MLRIKRIMAGTGIIFPMTETMKTNPAGRPMANPKGIAARSSKIGIMETPITAEHCMRRDSFKEELLWFL